LVEGELGYIGSSSKMLDVVPSDVEQAMTTKELAKEFVSKTDVDILAPSVGNIHGILKGVSNNPKLDIKRIANIAKSIPNTNLVLHGGSGVSGEDFKQAIKSGINIVHINTEIRRVYREGIEEAFKADREQVAPYKYLNKGRDSVSRVVESRLKLFLNS
ncbi:MAG: class II fructose-bisphosphate aldolase, partial [Candidatus Pacebacteria bacterium]|nr:class II fructose-bisphosphate aldolase [Candidatus Paceibacterota bacterium]